MNYKKSTIYTGPGSNKDKKKPEGTFGSFIAIFTDGWERLDKAKLLTSGAWSAGFALVGLLLVYLIPALPFENPALARMLSELLKLAVVVILGIVFSVLQKTGSPVLDTVLLAKGVGLGILYGLIWLGGSIAILRMYSVITFASEVKQIDGLMLWTAAVLARAVMTELFAHGVIFRMLRERLNFAVAATYAAIVFVALNADAAFINPYSFFTVLFTSIFFSAAVVNSGTVLTSIFSYYIWLLVGGLVLDVVCLPDDFPHMLSPEFTGSILLTGGTAKLEGSLIPMVISIMFIFSFYGMWVRKYQEEHAVAEEKAKRGRPEETLGPDKVRIGGRVYPNVETHIGQKTRYGKKSFLEKLKDRLN